MRPVRFREAAAADLRTIIDYYEDVAPASLENILADIHRSIDRLTLFPKSGMPVPGRSIRRVVTTRYHFKVAYLVEAEQIIVVGIYRYQDRSA
jgi:plasmid stabilization system protein ParE